MVKKNKAIILRVSIGILLASLILLGSFFLGLDPSEIAYLFFGEVCAACYCLFFFTYQNRKLRREAQALEDQSGLLKKAQQEAELAKDDAIRANRAKTRFLAHMSHEIRTPINSIIGMDEMILRESREGTVREYAGSIRQASQSLLYIINDILDITRIESDKMELIPVEYNLGNLIQGVMEMLSLKAASKHLVLKTDAASNLPATLYGDEVRIRQILTNLISNAIKFTHEGSVTLIVNGQQENGIVHLHFAVKDTGIGIKEEDIEKLGLAFERIEASRNRNIEGSGLGINICMSLLGKMGSKLEVDSEYGKGSVFSFNLEQKIINAAPMRLEKDPVESTDRSPLLFIAPNAKILVVDDNAMNRRVFTGLLRKTRIHIDEADSGRKCLEMVRRSHYDLIFLDHMMPELNGVDTFKEMQSWDDYPCKNTPKIMLTANAMKHARSQYLDLGFDGFIAKPIIIRELEELIQKLLPDELVVVPSAADIQTVDMDEACKTIEDLPAVDNIFWGAAKTHFTSVDLLLDAVSDYCNAIHANCQMLEMIALFASTNNDASSYIANVSNLKSDSEAIGAMPLAGICSSLIQALDARQTQNVLTLAPLARNALEALREPLEHILPTE